jgi:hypothetical protein
MSHKYDVPVDERLINIQEDIKSDVWELYRKLGGSYDSSFDQMNDLKRLGEMATAWLSVVSARDSFAKGENK